MGTIVIGCIVLVIMAVFIVGAVFAYKSYKTPSNKARVDQWQRHGNDTYETTRGKSGGDKKQSFSPIFHSHGLTIFQSKFRIDFLPIHKKYCLSCLLPTY